ncbi:hypothetical protein [Streptomyces europaeiscabiei]|uniref:hypothetical protein n=1 Tax=Streptomyces europaeiscabiei TaxID=146819 RepID=UPI0029BD290B|nr:hypothetical protein [Streptomyces europaeiscabiei]MDX3664878.1 hypothetical protein [Streptomyces europaeiscabiei]
MTRWRPGERVTTSEGAPRPPLPNLPGFPAMRGYGQLRDSLGALAFRHVADVLRPPGAARPASFGTLPRSGTDGGFRVLDGVWLPGRGTLWQRVDSVCLGQVRAAWVASDDPRAAGAAAVVDTLEGLLHAEPLGLRQVLLWQLACLLRDGSGDPTAEDAVALGVHREEAADLASAVVAGFPGAGGARQAAERLGDIWPGRRLREAGRLAARVRDPGGDPVLAGLLSDLRARTAELDRVIADAARTEEQGSAHAAALHWLVAARRTEDDPLVRSGLLRTATANEAAGDDTRVTAVEHHRAVHLMWPGARDRPESVTYRVLRFPDGSPGDTDEVRASVERGSPNTREGGDPEPMHHLRDSDPPIGRPVRYAVVPQRRGVVADVPLVSSVVMITPEVTDPDVAVVPDGVRLRWRADPACVDVVARRALADSSPARWVPVPCDRHGLLDVPLPAGEYRYEIRCGYPGPDGRSVWSWGVQMFARAEEWPDPVADLSARLADEHDRVTLAWRPPARGRALVLPWRGGPVAPGTDVSTRTDLTVPGSTTDAPPPVLETAVPEGSRLRVTSVSVLGERAVTGAGLVVENPGRVRDLTARRTAADRARVAFAWPDPAVLVLVTWQGDGHRDERRVARSRFLADGHVELPVTEGAYRVTVSALCRPDALAVPADDAVVDLAPMPPPTPPPAPPLFPVHERWAPWRRWWAFRR